MSETILRWKKERDFFKKQAITWVLRIEPSLDSQFVFSPTFQFEQVIAFPQIPTDDPGIYDQLAQFSKERYGVRYSQIHVWIENDWTNPSPGDYYYITDYMSNYDPLSDY